MTYCANVLIILLFFLNFLAVLPIESCLTKKLDYDEIIDTFANEKARRKYF